MSILAEILSSKVREEFFRILFGVETKEYHLRDIQRKAGLAIGTVRQEAIKLEKIGLIKKRINGNRTYYTANRVHPLYDTLHTLVLKTSGLADILRQTLDIQHVKYAFIFGSVASGTDNDQSDIDLFIIGNIGLRALSKMLKEPIETIGREINPHIMTLEEFVERKKSKEHFVKNIMDAEKIMIKGTEDDFERLGK